MTYDDDLKKCWALNSCKSCLSKRAPNCLWCPFSNACVPVPSQSFLDLPLLSPVNNPLVCPTPEERWEVRTHGLGCNVSTRTFITTGIGIFSTLFLVGMIFAIVWTIRSGVLNHLKRIGGEESGMPWRDEDGSAMRWRRGVLLWSPPRRSSVGSSERRPLLGQTPAAVSGNGAGGWWQKGWFGRTPERRAPAAES